MLRSRLILFISCAILIAQACSTTKSNDYENNVRAFITQFEKNLTATDEVILTQFRIQQGAFVTPDGILKTVHVMQNRDQEKDSISCSVKFNDATITPEGAVTRVKLPVQFISLDPTYAVRQDTCSITLWLTHHDDGLFINNILADNFYSLYRSAVSDLKYEKNRERDIASRQLYFQQARELQQTYDSVAWYSNVRDSIYYYVANGEFTNEWLYNNTVHPKTFTMGLVSETGRVIVPPTFDLVGTIGFVKENVIEVKKDGLVGHYNLEGKELVPAKYDMIIPFDADNVYALVKQDTLNGWLNEAYAYHAGFPTDEAKEYIHKFAYLSTGTLIGKDVNNLTVVLHIDYMGSALVIPPSYLVTAGILPEVVTEVNMGDDALGDGAYFGTAYIKSDSSFFERISENLSALFIKIEGSYLGGREDFYRYKNLTFVDNKGRVMGSQQLYSGKNHLTRIDSTLLELNTTPAASEANEYWDMGDEPGDWNPPQFRYFRISVENNQVIPLTSNRRFACTEFVKMDSAYLTGKFVYWDAKSNDTSTRDFVSNETIIDMRNEILAAYGFIFSDQKTFESFVHRDWYHARYNKYEEFWDELTEIDKHNLEFLETMIGTLRNQKPS